MKIQKMTSMILTVTVVLLLTVAVIVPIIGQQSESVKEYNTTANTGYDYLMGKGGSSYSSTIEYVSAGTYTVDGTTLTLTDDDVRVWVSDGGIIYLTATGGEVMSSGRSAVGSILFGDGDGKATTVAFSSGTMTVTLTSSSTITSTYHTVLYPDDAGKWAFFSGAFRVSIGQDFYGVGHGTLRDVAGVGTASDMDQLAANHGCTTAWTVTATAQEFYNAVSSVSVTLTDTSSNPQTATAIGCIAPLDYNSSLKESGANIVGDLTGIIPLVLIVGVIIMAVGYVARRD